MVWKLPSAAAVTAPIRPVLALIPAFPWYAWAGLGVGAAILLGGGVAAAAVAAPGGTGPTPKPGGVPPVLKLGSTGDWVAYLQDRLAMTVTGTFDEATDTAVKGFQSANGLTADGIVGPASWGKLGVSGAAPGGGGGGGGGGSPPPPPQPDQPPVPPPAPTTGNPFGLGALPPEREGQMLSFIDQGKFAHDWEPLDYDIDGHHVHVLASRHALALHDGSNRLIVSMTFNGAQKALDMLGGAMMTSRISDEIWKQAATKIGIPNKSWNTDSPVTGGKTSRMYEQSNDVQAKVAAKGTAQSGFVANEGKDWVITRRFWTNSNGGTNGNLPTDKPNGPAGVPGSPHNAANFGWYPGASKTAGGVPVTQSIGLAHDRGNAGGFVDYSQYVRGIKPDSLTIDGVPWDWGAALADPTVSKYIQDEGGTIPSPRHPDL